MDFDYVLVMQKKNNKQKLFHHWKQPLHINNCKFVYFACACCRPKPLKPFLSSLFFVLLQIHFYCHDIFICSLFNNKNNKKKIRLQCIDTINVNVNTDMTVGNKEKKKRNIINIHSFVYVLRYGCTDVFVVHTIDECRLPNKNIKNTKTHIHPNRKCITYECSGATAVKTAVAASYSSLSTVFFW